MLAHLQIRQGKFSREVTGFDCHQFWHNMVHGCNVHILECTVRTYTLFDQRNASALSRRVIYGHTDAVDDLDQGMFHLCAIFAGFLQNEQFIFNAFFMDKAVDFTIKRSPLFIQIIADHEAGCHILVQILIQILVQTRNRVGPHKIGDYAAFFDGFIKFVDKNTGDIFTWV